MKKRRIFYSCTKIMLREILVAPPLLLYLAIFLFFSMNSLEAQTAKTVESGTRDYYVNAFELLRAQYSRGDRQGAGHDEWSEEVYEYYHNEYVKLAKAAESSRLSDIEKKYLSTMALREGAALLTLLDIKKVNKKRFCTEFTPVYKSWDKFFSSVKNKVPQLEKKFASEVYRLHGDVRTSYSACVGGFSMIRLLVGTTDFFKSSLKANPNNPKAHFSMGTYRYYAPKIGGGDLNKALAQFNKVVLLGNETDKYVAHIFLAHTRMKKKNQPLALAQLALAKKIFPGGPYLNYAYRLINEGLFMK